MYKTPLLYIILQECLTDCIQNPLLISAPKRCQQISFRSVSGQAVNHHVPGNSSNAFFQNIKILIQFH